MSPQKAIRILRTVADVRKWRLDCTTSGLSVGFVPTMGSLHRGHCSLVSQALKENDRTMVSIFVNPAQFAPHEDFNSYPRSLDSDLQLLADRFPDRPVDVIFAPLASELYPSGIPLDQSRQFGAFVTVEGLSSQLEGLIRPQFFRGVATVVTKLLNVVQPTRAYFGQKDAQQCVVVKALVKDLLIDSLISIVPTLREENGLAMSSRNAYLGSDIKARSSIIFLALKSADELFKSKSLNLTEPVQCSELLQAVKDHLAQEPDFTLEYVSISDPQSLQELNTIDSTLEAILSIAVRVPIHKDGNDSETRLIDNILLKNAQPSS